MPNSRQVMGQSNVPRMKARGWTALVAGVFVVVLMAGTWVFVAKALAEHRIANLDTSSASFLGQMFTAFAAVIVCGFLGIANGIWQIRTGRRNRFLSIATIVVFVAAVGTVAVGVGSRHP